jgi:integrase
MPFPIHPHMLRHACGFKLANDGHDTRALQPKAAIVTRAALVCMRAA